MPRRTTPSILAHGIAVDPLYLSFDSYASKANFGLASVVVYGGVDRDATYSAQFEVCTF